MKINNQKSVSRLFFALLFCGVLAIAQAGFAQSNDEASQTPVVSQTVNLGNATMTWSVRKAWNSGLSSNGYIANIIITNTSNQVLHGWKLNCDFQDTIIKIWCASLLALNGGEATSRTGDLMIQGEDWNQDIPVGSSIDFGYKASSAGYLPVMPQVTLNNAVYPSQQ